jgi:hypothetical protein
LIRRDVDKEAIMGRVVREMGKADDDELAGIQNAVTSLLDCYESFMGGDLITYLCVWREAAQKHQANRAKEAVTATPLHAPSQRRAG